MLNLPKSKIFVCYIYYRSENKITFIKRYIEHGDPYSIDSIAYTVTEYIDKYYTSIFNYSDHENGSFEMHLTYYHYDLQDTIQNQIVLMILI